MNAFHEYLKEFLELCSKTHNTESLLCVLARFIEEKFPPSSAAILGILSAPMPFEGITKNAFTGKIIDEFMQDNSFEIKNTCHPIKYKDYLIIPFYDDTQSPRYIIAISGMPRKNDETVHDYAILLQNFLTTLRSHNKASLQKYSDFSASLFSHMIHDVNSLVTLVQEHQTVPQEILKKISYVERMTNDLIFYVRDLQIAPISINSEQIFRAILSDIHISDEIKFTVDIEKTKHDLFVDVELFSLAVKKIIENAIRAAQIKGKTLHINTQAVNGHRLSGNKLWFLIRISDNGPGIARDFIEMIKQPFFTTYKSHGHSGFGLSIAEKIINAHNGILNIYSLTDGGVQAEILLPLGKMI